MARKTDSIDTQIQNLVLQVQYARDLIKDSEKKVWALELEILALLQKRVNLGRPKAGKSDFNHGFTVTGQIDTDSLRQ